MRDPALVLCAVLVRAVDAALPQHDSVHVEAARVVAHVLVGRALAAPVWAVEVDGLRLFTGDVVFRQLAVHLVRRCEDECRLWAVQARGFEEVERAARIDLEIRDRIHKRCGHGHLACQVHDRVLAFQMSVEACVVAEVVFHELDAGAVVFLQPCEVAVGAGAAEVVEHSHVPALAGHVRGGVHSEEAGASADEHSTRHEGPYLSRSRTLSGTRWRQSRKLLPGSLLRGAWCRSARRGTPLAERGPRTRRTRRAAAQPGAGRL